jgi:hypothetical protein
MSEATTSCIKKAINENREVRGVVVTLALDNYRQRDKASASAEKSVL